MPNHKEIRQLLADPASIDWFRQALRSALERDPVDAAQDAYLLSIVLAWHSRAVVADALTSQAIRDASRR
ncbi:hypothetical protein [Malikia granosa]|uniref:Uncharacterized protein n=1 Tax=Malikia granosa TaxID=263067 RepID=A0A2S9K0N6_9BURK|nr:hypothetical protein [Malikia granosa]PRD63927.1 hypothetical protein C6P64_17040 [Malikia granosa]